MDRTRRNILKAGAGAAAMAAAGPHVFAQPSAPAGSAKFYQRGPVRIRYDESGSGFPLLLIAGGGLNSLMANLPRSQKGHASAGRHVQALEKVLPLLSEGSQVVWLGDAEYDTTEMLAWIEKNTAWRYALRTSPQIYVQTSQQEQPIRDFPLQRGKVLFLPQVGFTQTSSLILNVVGWWASRYEEPIFMVTNLDNPYQACRY